MIIYLLSNGPQVAHKLKSIDLKPEDLLVAFNSCACFKSEVLQKHENKIIMVRSDSHTNCSFLGMNHLAAYSKTFKEVIILRPREYTDQQMKEYLALKERYPNLILYDINKSCEYLQKNRMQKPGLSPQMGFLGYCWMKEQYPDVEVKLVDFSRFPNTNVGHSFKHEKQFYLKNDVQFI